MRLTKFTDYGLRVLILLGLTEDRLVTIEEIGDRYGISANHLMKVTHRLSTRGYIETVRGKGGGMRLARPPERIRLGDVVRDFEEDMTLVECFDPSTSSCSIEPSCRLQGVLRQSLQAFLRTLDQHSLADLVRPRGKLRALLEIESR
jgi:Rrf2 family nitric oxide-sensitive transcriptional repressor